MNPNIPDIDPASLKPGASVRILPAGQFRAFDGRPEGLPGWRIDGAIAATVMSVKPKGSSDFMIDYEHQSLNTAKNGQPAPAAGWFKRLEWREGDGLYMAGITWTEKARGMIAAKEYRHISPVFGFNRETGVVTYISSVALTNTPALTALTDLAAARAALSLQNGDASGLTMDERAKMSAWFGYDPASCIPQPAGFSALCAQVHPPNLAAMTEKDRSYYQKVFGEVFEAIGKPL